jgi:hypothetical protein
MIVGSIDKKPLKILGKIEILIASKWWSDKTGGSKINISYSVPLILQPVIGPLLSVLSSTRHSYLIPQLSRGALAWFIDARIIFEQKRSIHGQAASF